MDGNNSLVKTVLTAVVSKLQKKCLSNFNSKRVQHIEIDDLISKHQNRGAELPQRRNSSNGSSFQNSTHTEAPSSLQFQRRTFPHSAPPRFRAGDLQKLPANCRRTRSAKFYEEMGYFTRPKLTDLTDPRKTGANIRRVALTSRVILLIIQILSAVLIPRHENDGFRTPKDNLGEDGTFLDRLTNFTFAGFVNWDGEYFLHIASNGYTHENTIAFFPLFPALVACLTRPVHAICFFILSYQSIAQITGWCVNTWCFMESAVTLLKLVKFFDHGLYNLDEIVLFLFCYNPASIFFSSYYSESLYAYTTINVLLAMYERRLAKAIQFAALSALCRSNGLLNFGFIAAFILRDFLTIERKFYMYAYQRMLIFRHYCWILLQCALGLIPFALFQVYCSWKFCAKKTSAEATKLCDLQVLPYMYIQAKNWNVGFLRYFELAQLPNFLLAAPVLIILGYESYKRAHFYGQCLLTLRRYTCLPDFALSVHGLFLAFFCLCFIHVQVSTRMILSSCPYLYVYIAKSLRTEQCRHRAREINWLPYTCTIHTWCCTYFMVGTLLFSRGYPWT